MNAMQKAHDHPNFSMNLHNFRKHCREKGIESTNRNFLKYMEDFNDQSEYVPTILNVKHSYAPTYDYDPDDTVNDELDQEDLPF